MLIFILMQIHKLQIQFPLGLLINSHLRWHLKKTNMHLIFRISYNLSELDVRHLNR